MQRYDVILLGGGLANGLIAWRLRHERPELRILVVEQGERLGGNHTWSFYDTDITARQRQWLTPLIQHHWPSYSVRFPHHTRQLTTGYNSIGSDHFHKEICRRLGADILFNTSAELISPTEIRLKDSSTRKAPLLIDGRGWKPTEHLSLAYQKFVGCEVTLKAPHEQPSPIIMDATVEQHDGYRFLYTLPFRETEMLIEDTFYSNGKDLHTATITRNIEEYAAARGWSIENIKRTERGILPLVLAGNHEMFLKELGDIPTVGLRAGLFHHITGYSFPDAVRTADLIVTAPELASRAVAESLAQHSRKQWQDQGFYRILNRMLFLAGTPADRYTVLQRFYTLPQPLIERFYAGRTSLPDKARILCGKPPVPFTSALRSLPASAAQSNPVSEKVSA
jgi:lycopene beta-cyclase